MKKIHKTIIKVEVLSEEPYEHEDLAQLAHDVTYGECSGVSEVEATSVLEGKEAADAIAAQGSDPEFFGIDEDGNEVERGY